MNGCQRMVLGIALTSFLGSFASSAQAAFDGIYVFGDSLSDAGNSYAASQGTTPPSPPYSGGHFSNGPTWVDYLAQRLGQSPPTPSSMGGTNFAWGGAQSGIGPSPVLTPNLVQQAANFVDSGRTFQPNDLVTIWTGGNDFLTAKQTNPDVVARNIASAIMRLEGVGARRFVVPNLPLLGQLPLTSNVTDLERANLNALTTAFNASLEAQLKNLETTLPVQIYRVDVASKVQEVIANPSAFGFSNVTKGALQDNNTSGQGYLFWDDVHPTTAGHQLIGDLAAAAIPEPSSLVVVGTLGLAGIFWARRRRAA